MLIVFNMLISVISQYLSLMNIVQIKLRKKQKITIFVIFVINVILSLFIAKLSIFTMMVSLCIYYIISKCKPLQNICLSLLSYGLAAISSTFVSFVFGLAGIETNDISKNFFTLATAAITNWFILYTISRWVGKLIGKMITTIQLPRKMWYIILLNSGVVFFLMASNVIIGDYMGYSKGIIGYNSILFALLALVCGISIVLLVKAQIGEMENRIKTDSYNNLQGYTQKVEKMYRELRMFKHDYFNIIISMKGYIESGETEKLYQYFTENIEPLGNKIASSDAQLNQLMNVGSVEIKSLLSSKLIYAMEMGIDVRLEVLEQVEFVGINKVDLVTILGIFLDNAIEAAVETVAPQLITTVIRNERSVAIMIKNSYKVCEGLAYHNLGSIEISSKGDNRGIGLYKVKQLLAGYPHVMLDTSYGRQYFEQHLEITD